MWCPWGWLLWRAIQKVLCVKYKSIHRSNFSRFFAVLVPSAVGHWELIFGETSGLRMGRLTNLSIDWVGKSQGECVTSCSSHSASFNLILQSGKATSFREWWKGRRVEPKGNPWFAHLVFEQQVKANASSTRLLFLFYFKIQWCVCVCAAQVLLSCTVGACALPRLEVNVWDLSLRLSFYVFETRSFLNMYFSSLAKLVGHCAYNPVSASLCCEFTLCVGAVHQTQQALCPLSESPCLFSSSLFYVSKTGLLVLVGKQVGKKN